MSIFGSIESLALALHRKGYDSNDRERVKSFVRLHRVDLFPIYITDGNFSSDDFFTAVDAVANSANAMDCAKAFKSLALEIEIAEDQLAYRIIDAIDDIEAYEKEAA